MWSVKKSFVFIGVCFMTVLPSGAAEKTTQSMVEIYLSPGGNDENPGTSTQPFRTLEKARAVIRAGDDRGKKPIVVWLQGGRYFRTKTFDLCEKDSGTQNAPVSYKAVAGQQVVLDGGITISSSECSPVTDAAVLSRFVPEARGKILQIDLRALGVTDYGTLGPRASSRPYLPAPLELMINNQPMDIARWPNIGQPLIELGKVLDSGSIARLGDYSLRPAVFEYVTPRAERWTQAGDIYIAGFFHFGWADDTILVDKIDPEAGTIRTAYPHLYGFTNRVEAAWYAMNLIEEIDMPGEYCVDRKSGIVYFFPPCDMKNALIQVSVMKEPMVALEGASYIRLENLTFEDSRGTAVYIERGKACLIAGCTMRNLGMVGVQIGKGVRPLQDGLHNAHGKCQEGLTKHIPESRVIGSMRNYLYANTAWNREGGYGHSILSCNIYNTGAGGIILGGGDRKTLTPAGNSVENCDIHHVNRLDRANRACVNIDGVGNCIRNCHLHDTTSQAVLLHGNDHIVEFNRINNVLTDLSDAGAVYMGRDPSESGNMFRFNFFYNILNFHKGEKGVQAIFFDDTSICGATIFGNVFYKAGSSGVIKFNGGGLCAIENNIFIDCPLPVYVSPDNHTERVREFMASALGQTRLRQAVDILAPPYVTKYPVLKEVYDHKIAVTIEFERNYIASGDLSEFENPAGMNFKLKDNAKVFREIEGFEPIPFQRIGLYIDGYRTTVAP